MPTAGPAPTSPQSAYPRRPDPVQRPVAAAADGPVGLPFVRQRTSVGAQHPTRSAVPASAHAAQRQHLRRSARLQAPLRSKWWVVTSCPFLSCRKSFGSLPEDAPKESVAGPGRKRPACIQVGPSSRINGSSSWGCEPGCTVVHRGGTLRRGRAMRSGETRVLVASPAHIP